MHNIKLSSSTQSAVSRKERLRNCRKGQEKQRKKTDFKGSQNAEWKIPTLFIFNKKTARLDDTIEIIADSL